MGLWRKLRDWQAMHAFAVCHLILAIVCHIGQCRVQKQDARSQNFAKESVFLTIL